jgi:peroxiredoxin
MAVTNRQSIYLVTSLFLVFVLVLGVLHGCKREKADGGSPNSVESASTDPINAAASLFREPKANIQNIVKAAQTWNPSFEDWWGRPAPDFALTDIEGRTHNLSDYRGKEVIVEIWRTWNPTCKLEVPHLTELRGAFDQDSLVILAVSNETPDVLKAFVTEQGINYAVLSSSGAMPAPFGEAEFSPATFFVDREGRIKVAGVGVVPASDAKAIIQAK